MGVCPDSVLEVTVAALLGRDRGAGQKREPGWEAIAMVQEKEDCGDEAGR